MDGRRLLVRAPYDPNRDCPNAKAHRTNVQLRAERRPGAPSRICSARSSSPESSVSRTKCAPARARIALPKPILGFAERGVEIPPAPAVASSNISLLACRPAWTASRSLESSGSQSTWLIAPIVRREHGAAHQADDVLGQEAIGGLDRGQQLDQAGAPAAGSDLSSIYFERLMVKMTEDCSVTTPRVLPHPLASPWRVAVHSGTPVANRSRLPLADPVGNAPSRTARRTPPGLGNGPVCRVGCDHLHAALA